MAFESLDFGYVLKTLGTAVNMIVGLFGTADDQDSGEQFESDHWSHFGFDARPHPPDDKGGRCEVIFSRHGDVTICTKDRRYRVNLKDGEVALFTGEDGKVKCKQVLKPDGTVLIEGKNVGVTVSKDGGDGGEMVVSVKKSLTLSRTEGTASLITIKDDGGIQAVSSGGSHMTLDPAGKAVLAVDKASVILDGQKAIINAAEISIVGSAGVGLTPVQVPVATVGCMAGPFPIANGSMALKAQFP